MARAKNYGRKSPLREKAEERLKINGGSNAADLLTDGEIRRTFLESQVHQAELEIQNEELRRVQLECDAVQKIYKELYDHAPVGYLTLDRNGMIRKSNLAGAKHIGMERSRLVDRQFAVFVSEKDRPTFQSFLGRVFAGVANETCELTLLKKGGDLVSVIVDATVSEDGKECHAVLTDVTEQKKVKNALAKSEMLYRDLFEKSPIGVFQYSPLEGRLLRVNEAFAKLLGYESPDEMISTITDSSQLHAGSQNYSDALVHMEKQDSFHAEYPLLCKDGNVVTTKVSIHKVLNPDGTVDYFNGFVQDITEQRKLEEEQKRNLDEITDLYENAPCGYHSLTEDGTYLRVNKTELAWLGYSREEMIGKMKLPDLLAPEEKEKFKQKFSEFKKQGWARDHEYTLIRKDGGTFPILINATVIRDEDGNYLMSRGSLFDNTERKKMEDALAKSEALYRNLFENASIGMFQSSLEGRFLRINKAYAAMLGYESPEEVISSITDTATQIHTDSRNRNEALAALEKHGWYYAEQSYLRKDGSIMIGKLAVRKVVSRDGAPSYLEGIVEDITERKQAEEALRKSESDLRIKAKDLAEVNTTMRVLLNTMEKDQEELEEKFLRNLKVQVLPYLRRLKKTPLNEVQKGYLKLAEDYLGEVASPFVQKLTSNYLNLTKKELEVAALVKEGKTSKEIAEILNSTKRAIEFHRENIRKKLDVSNRKCNLTILLRSYS